MGMVIIPMEQGLKGIKNLPNMVERHSKRTLNVIKHTLIWVSLQFMELHISDRRSLWYLVNTPEIIIFKVLQDPS